jgi:hypothetical protein
MQRAERGLWGWPWERWSALGGAVAVALWVIGALILFADEPDTGSPQEVLSYYQDSQGQIFAGGWLFMTGVLLFVWFLSALRARFIAVEGPLARVTTLAFASGIAVSIFLIALPSTNVSGAVAGDDLTPEAAQALQATSGIFFGGAEMMGVLFLAATGVLILRTGALLRWWGWVTLVLALWLFILPIGWVGLLLGFPAWVLVTSILLWRGTRTAATPAERTSMP